MRSLSFSQVNEGLHRHSFHSPPETLDMTSPTNVSKTHLRISS